MASPALEIAQTIRSQLGGYQPESVHALTDLLSDEIQLAEAIRDALNALKGYVEEHIDPALGENLGDAVGAAEDLREALEHAGDEFIKKHKFWLRTD